MNTLLAIFVLVHIAAGFVGLGAFWVPIFSRKGGGNHRLYGRVFKYCAYVVLWAALVSVSIRITDARVNGVSIRENPDDFGFIFFLGYLAIVTLIGMRHGFKVLDQKQDLTRLNTGLNVASGWLAIAASVFVIGFALLLQPANMIILLALSPLGFNNGISILRVVAGKRTGSKVWFYEHMGALMGSGIAFHTAFAVFGSVQLFDLGLEGFIAVIPWVAPAMIGIPAISIWTRHYKRKFGDAAA